MKYKLVLLKTVAAIAAFSVAVTGEGAVFAAVYAAPGSVMESYDTPDNLENPESPDDSGNPDNPGTPGNLENPDTPENPENPDDSGNPDNPGTPGNLEDPDTPENPENPDDSGNPDNPDTPGNPEEPADPDTPDTPKEPLPPILPEEPDSVSENDLTGETEEEEGIALLADGEYGVATADGDCGAQGDNLKWTYYAETETETLVISRPEESASGAMADYGTPPWNTYKDSITRLVIEEGVETIGKAAFNGCSALTGEVCLPSTLAEIKENAFSSCTGLKELTFANGEGNSRSLTFGRMAFAHCRGLEHIRFPDNLTELKAYYNYDTSSDNAYYECSSLKELTIPGSLKNVIGRSDSVPGSQRMGFAGMQFVETIIVEEGIESIEKEGIPIRNLKEIRLPSTMTEIVDNLVQNAPKLEKVYPTGETPEEGVALKLPEKIAVVGAQAFSNCIALTGKAEFPAALAEIKENAFQSCPGLTELTFANGEGNSRSLTFGKRAFAFCRGLEHIYFPDNLTELKAYYNYDTSSDNAYYECSSLKELTIPGSLKEVTGKSDSNPGSQRMGFAGMQFVETIIVEEGIESIEKEGIPLKNLKEIQLPSTMTEIADSLFQSAKKLEKVYLTGETPEEGAAIKLPEKITVIGTRAFYECTALAGEVHFPSGLTEIKDRAFQSCSGLTGDLVIPDQVVRIGDFSFNGCSGLGEHLYLGDGLQWVGDAPLQGCPGITNLHTGLQPVGNIKNYSSTFTEKVIHSIWYRGTDDTDTITVNGKNVGWATLFNADGNSNNSFSFVEKIYIDTTVNRLSEQSFWKKYADVSFVGPNVVTFSGEVFPAAPIPLSQLSGTFYVTEEGVLYTLDAAAGIAALAYCPPGITELYIPSFLTATEEMTGEPDKRYARSYKVAGVTQHAVMAAVDLTTVTAANPRQITLGARAFADCPTLTSVNGVTTQKEANALFGINGTPAIKKAFANTGLSEEEGQPSTQGKPMRALNYTNPNVGGLTVELVNKNGGEYTYENDAYQVLTGERMSFSVAAKAFGTESAVTRFRIYFEPADPDFWGMKEYTSDIPYQLNGGSYNTSLHVSYDRVIGCYCVSFSLPSGATTTLSWDELGQNRVRYPSFLDEFHNLEGRPEGKEAKGTKGGMLTVWGEVLDFTGADTPDGEEAEDEIFGGFSGSVNYMSIHWSTKRNLYKMEIGNRSHRAAVDSATHKSRYGERHGIALYTSERNFSVREELNNSNLGRDRVTGVKYRYVVTLPDGMTWAEEDVFARSNYPQYDYGATGKLISVSEDRKTLTYEVTHAIPNFDRITNIIGPYYVSKFDLGYSYQDNSLIVIGEDWDYFSGEHQITYECTPTFYYQFSEPDEAPTVTAYETLQPTEAGIVELHRRYTFPEGRGRGLPMRISFEAENKGKDPANLNLQGITDETVNFNGYLYLSAEQMAAAILSGNENLETTKIEIQEAVLYPGRSYESGVTHTGTDGGAQVMENLLNTYNEPNPVNKGNLTLSVDRQDAADGSSTEENRHPTELTISVNGARRETIAVDGTDDVETLTAKLDAALRNVGYVAPTGLYRITWRATDAARSHVLGSFEDTEQKTYLWEIGAYEATVKPDYLQGHRWIQSDSDGFMRLFDGVGSDAPTAKAVFTIDNNTRVEEKCNDRAYGASVLSLKVDSFDSRTGDRVLVGNNQAQWICPGVILDYQAGYQNGNSIPFGDMPFMQTFDSSQCLLAPVDKNPDLADAGYPKLSDSAYVSGKFRERDYYLLLPGETRQNLTGVWLGGDSAAGDFYVESVSIAGTESGEDKGLTVIRWYEKEIGPYYNGGQKDYRFYTYVLMPGNVEERPAAASVVYANNYVKENGNGGQEWSTRLRAAYEGNYQQEGIAKDIITNPQMAGTAQEETPREQRSTYLGAGASVTYRLAFDEYWIGEYTLPAGALYDLLPCTYGVFEWELGENVQVKYALKERVAQEGAEAVYETYTPAGADFARIDKVREPIGGTGEPVEQHKLSFGAFTIPYNRTLYVYVTLTFPEGETWESFAGAADVNLLNTLYYGNLRSDVSHMIARPTQVFLKTGMYGTDGDPYGYLYPNSDEESRIVKYYVVIYNHGKGYLYLNPVHILIPEGFTLKNPPKTYANGRADWNLGDVSVNDGDAPTRLNRMSIADVKVTYPEDGAGEREKKASTEAVLDINIDSPYNSYNHDDVVGKDFLRPGQYVVMEVRFETGGYQETPDKVQLPAAMPVDDSHHVGRIVQVQGVDAHRNSYVNSNEGTPEFWEDNAAAVKRGFTVPDYADTGKWAASEVSLTREEAKPGVIKNAPAKKKVDEIEMTYDPQDGVSLTHPVKWETKLVNGGANSLTGYEVKDSVQWPYVFDGEVRLTSQIAAHMDDAFTISRFTQNVMLGSETVEKIDRSQLKVNGDTVRIADSRADAMTEGSGCYTTVFHGARVYFYKADVFGDGKPAETMEFDFTTDRTYGVGPASYQGGRVYEKSRTLSYWTKFDRSQKNTASRTSYANRMVMEPLQPYTKADVCEGIAIDENGEPVRDDGDVPDGIMAVGYVSVNVGQSTAAWMKGKENKKPDEEEQGPEVSDDIKEVLSKENKMIIGAVDNTVTYTMHVLNHVASGDPNDTVQSADDRRYSIKDMVIINTLPHEGDRMPFNSKVPRNSDYKIIADKDNFHLSLYYYDPPAGGETESEIPEGSLKEISPDCYQILYSESETVVSGDWKFNENSGAGWNATKPSAMSSGWKFAEEFEDITKVRSVRIEIKDPNTVFDADPDKINDYRSLMKGGRIIVVKYQARVETGKDENGTDTPTPGECAWNSFGYRFERFDGSAPMEASSIRTGVQIPSIPILYERLIDYDQNPYANPGEPEAFVFTIDKQEGEREDGTARTAQQLRFTVTVDTGKAENYRELRNIRNNPEITLWNGEGQEGFTWDGTAFWEDGASYVVKQVSASETLPLFSIKVNGQTTTGFVYDPLYEPVIVVTNQSRVWSSRLYKMDADSKGYDPEADRDKDKINFLPGALFGLYTADREQAVDIDQIKEEAGERYEWRERYKALLHTMMEVDYGEGDTAVKLYLKDFAVTDENGEIKWLNLEDDTYYVRELNPPRAYALDETFHQINRKNAVVSVYDEPGIRFPLTGGIGTIPFYITGGIFMTAGGILGERRGRRRRKKKKEKKDGNGNGERTKSRERKVVAFRVAGVTITLALAVKILVRVVQIRRERRKRRG